MSARHARKMPLAARLFLVPVLLSMALQGVCADGAVQEGSAKAQRQRVSVSTVQDRELMETIRVSGRWMPQDEVRLAPTLDGYRLTELSVDTGDAVHAGQVLARLDAAIPRAQLLQARQSMARAVAERRDAAARKEAAERSFRRASRLKATGATSGQDYESQKALYLEARAAWLGSMAGVRLAQAQLNESQIRLSQSEIVAPVDGVIARRYSVVGDMVGVQNAVFSLIRDNRLEFIADVSQRHMISVKTGMIAKLWLQDEGDGLPGKVRLVGKSLNTATGYGEIRIAVTGVSAPQVTAGTVGQAQLTLSQRHAVSLDVRALRYDHHSDEEGGSRANAYVMVVEENGRVKRKDVVTGLRYGNWVEIIKGPPVGSVVVLADAARLHEGDLVEGVHVQTTDSIRD